MHKLVLIAPLFLAGQAALVHWASGTEHPPKSPDLSKFAVTFGSWQMVREDPIEPGVQQLLHADGLLNRTYIQAGTSNFANLFIAWFQSQRGGASQPHSPQVCLPGSGWVPQVQDVFSVDTPEGKIDVNRYIVVNGSNRAAVFYWYQMGSHAIPSEWSAKFWTISSALTAKRTDTSLIRIVLQNGGSSDEASTSAATQFARDVYPLLKQTLPQ
jgi:EpsI family protein